MFGVVNTFFTHMLAEFKEGILAWTIVCIFERETTHGSPEFDANSCKKLLDRVDLLLRESSLDCLKYVKAYDNFSQVGK